MGFLILQLCCSYDHALSHFMFSPENTFTAAQLVPRRCNRCFIKMQFKRRSKKPKTTHTRAQSVYSPDNRIICTGVIIKSPITPQCLSLISHEWLICCDVWNHGRCETGCETVVSYVIALWRPRGLNHPIHSLMAANYAANDKWNIWPPLVTMARQGQDLTQATNTNKQQHCCLSDKQQFWLFNVILHKSGAEARYKAEWSLLNMTLEGWLEWNIRVISSSDTGIGSNLKALVRRRHAGRCVCVRCLLLREAPHQKCTTCYRRVTWQQRFPSD